MLERRPQRAEPLYDLARFYREKGMNDASVLFAEAGLAIPRPDSDVLFVEDYVYTAGLQEEYSIAANYARDPARKNRGFAACNWLALNRSIPDSPRNLARSNLYFYVQSITTMLPSFTARPVGFSPPDGYRPMNPSVAREGDQIVLVQRCVNYTLGEDNQHHTPEGVPVRTRNFLLRLSNELDIRSATEILPPTDMPEPVWTQILGFEDLRPFAWRGQLWASACVRELNEEGLCEQVLARIDDRGDGACRLTDWRVLRPEGPRSHEKNWMPQVDKDTLRFIKWCDPCRVLDEHARNVSVSTPAIAADTFKGGSQAITFEGGWLALTHESRVMAADNPRFYQHRFVLFDGGNALRGVSRPFFFQKKAVEFAAGLSWHPDGKRLLISYIVSGVSAWIATVDADEVRAILEDARYLPSGKQSIPREPEDSGARSAPGGGAQLEPVYHVGRTSILLPHAGPTEAADLSKETTNSASARSKISGFVISYNKASIIETCLCSLRFVDELIVVDKSSNDGTLEIAQRYADKILVVPWTPVVEHTRNTALELCSHDLIVYLDDDESLSPDAIKFILKESVNPSADVYSFPRRNYFLGRFDARTRDWPDYKDRFFRKGALELPMAVHAPVTIRSSNRRIIPADSPIFIYHFFCARVSEWIEKINRYTAQPKRESWFYKCAPLSADLVRQQTDYWFQGQRAIQDEPLAAYALLRVAYDIVDRVKLWEAEAGVDGEKEFAAICKKLKVEYDALGLSLPPER